MESRYNRNQIHISEEQQAIIKDFKILIAGCGIGSYIAECLIRLGFETLTIVDGDSIELTNLNRQNYTEDDLSLNKAEVLKKRLLSINKNAKINTIPEFITIENLPELKINHNVAINALDFSTQVPFIFDEVCLRKRIPIIHPYNLGWAAFVIVFTPQTQNIHALENSHKVFELNIGKFIVDSLKEKNIHSEWLEDFLARYEEIALVSPPPQLSIGVNLLSAMVSHIIFNIATNKPIKKFPDSYYLSLND